MSNNLRIGWIPPSRNLKSASFRLRVDEIMKGLRGRGHTCFYYDESADSDVLIVSKKYDLGTQVAMRHYRSRNPKGIIVFDICDNHFYTDSKNTQDLVEYESRVKMLRSALVEADAVTTASEYLAGVVAEQCQIDSRSIFTIEDCYEQSQTKFRPSGVVEYIAEIQYKWLEWRLNWTNKLDERFVWFGTHGVSYAEGGMFDLLERAKIITEAFRDSDRSLTIISNSYSKYREVSKTLKIRTYYLPWSKHTIDRALRLHTFLLLPIKASPFTLSKSINRPVTAMLNKLLVVCDMIPSYEKLSDYLINPIQHDSLTHVLSMSKEERARRVHAARAHVHNEYSPARITEKWESVLFYVINDKIKVPTSDF